MCGLVSLDGATAPDPAALAAMNETLVHGGPDSEGSLIDGARGLAMRRLSIIDLAGGDQPISNEDGRIQVIQNGETYNYRELMDELRGRWHTYSTDCDTEVTVNLYEVRGPSFAAVDTDTREEAAVDPDTGEVEAIPAPDTAPTRSGDAARARHGR
jgi:asparagine synthase (glutamine-hydrolysing)